MPGCLRLGDAVRLLRLHNSATATLTFGAADETNPRIETVVHSPRQGQERGGHRVPSLAELPSVSTPGPRPRAQHREPERQRRGPGLLLRARLRPGPGESDLAEQHGRSRTSRRSRSPGCSASKKAPPLPRPPGGEGRRFSTPTNTKHYWIDNEAARWEALLNVASTAAYTEAMTARAANTNLEPSATRPTFVTAAAFFGECCRRWCEHPVPGRGRQNLQRPDRGQRLGKQRTVVSFLVPPALEMEMGSRRGRPGSLLELPDPLGAAGSGAVRRPSGLRPPASSAGVCISPAVSMYAHSRSSAARSSCGVSCSASAVWRFPAPGRSRTGEYRRGRRAARGDVRGGPEPRRRQARGCCRRP